MVISVNFSRLEAHLSHLEQELQISRKIRALLEEQYELISAVALNDVGGILMQMDLVDREIRKIQAREKMLTEMLDTYKEADRRMKEKLSEMHTVIKKP